MKKTKCPQCGFLFPLADVSASASILGRKGGAVKSERKACACRANGRKGGRPITRSGYLGEELNKFPCQYGIESEEELHPCGKPSMYKAMGGKVYFCEEHAPEVEKSDEETWKAVKP